MSSSTISAGGSAPVLWKCIDLLNPCFPPPNMPLHFDCPSRRHFLGTTALLGGGWLTRFTAAASGDDLQKFALLSDTHIAADPELVARDAHLCRHLSTVVREVLAAAGPFASVFLNGDAAYNDGQKADYEQLLRQLEPLRKAASPPLHINLGNHDDRNHFLDTVKPGDPSPLQSKQVALVEGRHVNWFLLDTLREVNKVEGELGREQMGWLEDSLKAHPDKPAIVMGHHNPQFPPSPTPDQLDKAVTLENFRISGLLDTVPFVELLERHRQVKAYVFGHTHAWTNLRRPSGLQFINLPPVAYVFQKERPSGWVEVVTTARKATFHLHSLDKGHQEEGAEVEIPLS